MFINAKGEFFTGISIYSGGNRWLFDDFELDAGVHYCFETEAGAENHCFILVYKNHIGDYCWYDDGSCVWEESEYFR